MNGIYHYQRYCIINCHRSFNCSSKSEYKCQVLLCYLAKDWHRPYRCHWSGLVWQSLSC